MHFFLQKVGLFSKLSFVCSCLQRWAISKESHQRPQNEERWDETTKLKLYLIRLIYLWFELRCSLISKSFNKFLWNEGKKRQKQSEIRVETDSNSIGAWNSGNWHKRMRAKEELSFEIRSRQQFFSSTSEFWRAFEDAVCSLNIARPNRYSF